MINKTFIEGNITKDVELKHVGEKGTPLVNTSIACNWWNSTSASTTYIDVTIWGKVAENVAKYCRKGNKLTVFGHLQNNSYTNQQGIKITRTVLVAEEVSFDPKANENRNMANNNNNSQFDSSIVDEATNEFGGTPNINIDDSNLPFY